MSSAGPITQRLELLLFSCTFVLYGVVAILAHRPDLIWDEGRYLMFADNLTRGYYVIPEKPDFSNGPGYPLVLAALMALKVPLAGLRLINAVFMALAVWFSYRAVLPYAGRLWAVGVALVTALHPNLIRTAPYVMTEALTVCCVAGFAWAFTATLRAEKWRWSSVLAAAFAFGWLILTRVFFGHVLMAGMVFLLVGWVFWKSQRRGLLRAGVVMALAFCMCVPWLAYTQAKTGDTLCWSTNGGELLYWATSTNDGENGHWFSEEEAQNMPELVANGHSEFYQTYFYLPVQERETALKQKALENIRANPKGVVKNWLCNWCRLLFGFPRSYLPEELSTVVLLLVNGPLLFLGLASFCLALKHRGRIPLEIVLLAGVVFIYLGGTSLLPGLPRYTVVVWPWIGLGIAGVLSRHLSLKVA
ncbi:MAG: glycosyltransferase family 39 protein [Prosthecobacter sp.]|uniref:ArnT family glycosyltransferase n=1 Tax=Prosthecobacter sp. TaxID=1965333 RepID=UPI0025F1CF2B|nr:glycosyltransferase family 39 protein [Prosthecobacter sp.]MCF7787850.1 glycosyltransferase family 39 protein [Prosthecobacter sp.]